jgi:glucosamine--fructose-6-phosphate aminotransferase (isomerizing)
VTAGAVHGGVQMVAFALVARSLGRVPFDDLDLAALPECVSLILADRRPVERAIAAVVGATRLVVVARGYLYGAALETALKIKETCALLADGYSSADLRHGPIAAVTPDVPVIALNVRGQQLARGLSLALGFDPDAPAGLSKVTMR